MKLWLPHTSRSIHRVNVKYGNRSLRVYFNRSARRDLSSWTGSSQATCGITSSCRVMVDRCPVDRFTTTSHHSAIRARCFSTAQSRHAPPQPGSKQKPTVNPTPLKSQATIPIARTNRPGPSIQPSLQSPSQRVSNDDETNILPLDQIRAITRLPRPTPLYRLQRFEPGSTQAIVQNLLIWWGVLPSPYPSPKPEPDPKKILENLRAERANPEAKAASAADEARQARVKVEAHEGRSARWRNLARYVKKPDDATNLIFQYLVARFRIEYTYTRALIYKTLRWFLKNFYGVVICYCIYLVVDTTRLRLGWLSEKEASVLRQYGHDMQLTWKESFSCSGYFGLFLAEDYSRFKKKVAAAAAARDADEKSRDEAVEKQQRDMPNWPQENNHVPDFGDLKEIAVDQAR